MDCGGGLRPSGLESRGVPTYIAIGRDRRTMTYHATGQSTDPGAARTATPIPMNIAVFYFELRVLEAARPAKVGIGIGPANFVLNRTPGAEANSFGMRSEDGRKLVGNMRAEPYTSSWGKGDVVGCGVNFTRNKATVFFTRNGQMLEEMGTLSSQHIALYPVVSTHSLHDKIRVNFGCECYFGLDPTCVCEASVYSPSRASGDTASRRVTNIINATNYRAKRCCPRCCAFSPNPHPNPAESGQNEPFVFDLHKFVQELLEEERDAIHSICLTPPPAPYVPNSLNAELVVKQVLLHGGFKTTAEAFERELRRRLPWSSSEDTESRRKPADSVTTSNGTVSHSAVPNGSIDKTANGASTGDSNGLATNGVGGPCVPSIQKSDYWKEMICPTEGPGYEALVNTLPLRAEIRELIHSGDVERALERLLEAVPSALSEKPMETAVALLLTQRVVELIRRAGSVSSRSEDRQEGIIAALEFLRTKIAPQAVGATPAVEQILQDTTALLAYPNPSASPLALQLDPARRLLTADWVNRYLISKLTPVSPWSPIHTTVKQIVTCRHVINEARFNRGPVAHSRRFLTGNRHAVSEERASLPLLQLFGWIASERKNDAEGGKACDNDYGVAFVPQDQR